MFSKLLRTQEDGYYFLLDMKSAIACKAQEAEDLHNSAIAKELSSLAEYIGQISKKLSSSCASMDTSDWRNQHHDT